MQSFIIPKIFYWMINFSIVFVLHLGAIAVGWHVAYPETQSKPHGLGEKKGGRVISKRVWDFPWTEIHELVISMEKHISRFEQLWCFDFEKTWDEKIQCHANNYVLPIHPMSWQNESEVAPTLFYDWVQHPLLQPKPRPSSFFVDAVWPRSILGYGWRKVSEVKGLSWHPPSRGFILFHTLRIQSHPWWIPNMFKHSFGILVLWWFGVLWSFIITIVDTPTTRW